MKWDVSKASDDYDLGVIRLRRVRLIDRQGGGHSARG
jgi:hypothetical protein